MEHVTGSGSGSAWLANSRSNCPCGSALLRRVGKPGHLAGAPGVFLLYAKFASGGANAAFLAVTTTILALGFFIASS